MPLLKGESIGPKIGDIVYYADNYLGSGITNYAGMIVGLRNQVPNDTVVNLIVFRNDGTSELKSNVETGDGEGFWHNR